MKKSRFTESQIVEILKEGDSGRPVQDLWRKHGISSATYYKWKAKYGGLDVNELKRMKEIEAENSKLKRRSKPCRWSLDFVSDALYCGRRFRTLNVLDEGVREGLGIEVDTSLPSERVVRVLEQITSWRGYPKEIRCDNGPEFLSQAFADWCRVHEIGVRYIQPGKPNQNAYIERFNRTYREEVLDFYLFEDLDQVREITHEWLGRYNEQRMLTCISRELTEIVLTELHRNG